MYILDFKKPCNVYFMGIGGISMSGLAEILLKEGFSVSGSDIRESSITKNLSALGATINIEQVAANITDDIDLAVYTAAVRPGNEEFEEVKNHNIPMLNRAELLGQVMSHYKYSIAVSGTHGKTTTTSMMAHALLAANTDPTISIGGMLPSIGGNIRVSQSEYFVTEACEYTNSYHSLNPYISIILNVDEDHLDFFSGIKEIADSFKTFANLLPDDGLLVINGDMEHKDYIVDGLKCNIYTFGLDDKNKYIAKDITYDSTGYPTYTLVVDGQERGEVTLKATGLHNVLNSLSVIAASDFLGLDFDSVTTGLAGNISAKRRFEYKGVTSNGVTVIDDYAHHPTEIATTLNTAKNIDHGELWCVFQPHTYSRTKAHLSDFAKVLSTSDHVLLADIYAAREVDTGEVSSKDLCDLINSMGGNAIYFSDFESIKEFAKNNCKKSDLLITMGAGDIDLVGEMLLKN